MKRIRSWVLVALLATPVVAAAAGTIEDYGFEAEQVRLSLMGALRGYYFAADVPQTVRALPPEERVAVVQALGGFAKSFYSSADFKKGYAEAYKASKPKGFGLPSLNVEDLAKQSATAAMGKGGKPAVGSLDKDPRVQLKRSLQAYLDATSDVDFSATTHASGTMRVFDKPEYEAKPREWKMCFRAGKEVSDAVREFATAWLKELK